MIVTVIENDASCPLDRFAEWLTEPAAGPQGEAQAARPVTGLRIVRAWAGDAVPADAGAVGDGLLVLGGPAHAYDDQAMPWLAATKALLADTVRAGVPTLALCLGAQVLAVATGGRVQVAAPPGCEWGVIDIHPRPEAVRDPLLGALAAHVAADHPLAGGVMLAMPSMHSDAVVDLPPGAAWLATSRLYPYQAFRVGEAAWGLQFHPEVSEPTFAAWADLHEDVDTAEAVAQLRAQAELVEAGGRAIAHRFRQLVEQRAADEAALVAQPTLSLSR